MGDRADLHANQITGSASVVGRRTRLRSIYNGATAGTVEMKDGGSGGTSKLVLTVGANQDFDFPGGGILFETDCYATLTTTNDVTFLFE